VKLLSISIKILAGFVFLLAIFLLVSGMASYYMLQLREMVDFLKGNYTSAMLNSQELMANLHLSANSAAEIIREPRTRDDHLPYYNSAKEGAFKSFDSIDANLKDSFLSGAPNVIAFKQTTESNILSYSTSPTIIWHCHPAVNSARRAKPYCSRQYATRR